MREERFLMSKRIAAAGLIGILVSTGVLMAAPDADASKRPNVVLICLQGVPASATGFGGNEVIKTPHLDALASEAVQFARAYTPIPQAGPARASLLTGQYPHSHRVTDDGAELSNTAVTFSEILQDAGYTCGLVGTWRLPGSGEQAKDVASPANATPPPGHAAGPSAPPHGMMHPPETPLPGPGRPTGARFLAGQTTEPTQPTNAPPTTQHTHLPASQPAGSRSAGADVPHPGSRPALAGSRPAMAESQPEINTSQPAAGGTQLAEAMEPQPVPPPAPVVLPPVEKPGFGFKYSATSDLGGPLEKARVYVNGKQEDADKYLSDWHTDRAVKFIKKSKSKPFLLCLFLPGPGEPLTFPPGEKELYPPEKLPNTPIEQPDAKNVPSRVRTSGLFQKSPKQAEQLRQQQSRYYANVSHLDENVGRVLKALADAGVDERTLVIVTSDQGYATGDKGAWGMGPAFWEDLVRCPLLVRLPKGRHAEKKAAEAGLAETQATRDSDAVNAKAGCVKQIVSLVDLAPTVLDAVGLPVPLSMQGRSLLPATRSGADEPYAPDECFIEYEKENAQPMPARVLISGQYKLVDYLQDSDQFYDLKRDPKEEYNLVDVQAYSAMVKVMRARMDHWRKRTKDK